MYSPVGIPLIVVYAVAPSQLICVHWLNPARTQRKRQCAHAIAKHAFVFTTSATASLYFRSYISRSNYSARAMSSTGSAAPDAQSSSTPAEPPHHYLELSAQPIRFDAVSQLTNVFFDDSNRQVFAVRSGGATGIVVKGPQPHSAAHSFCMDDKGPIRSIKFTADNRVLAVQRTDAEIEFIDFQPERGQPRQPLEPCTYRGRGGQIYGFVWIGAREVAVISAGGIELLAVQTERKQCKSLKSLAVSVEWFSWSAQSQLTVLATNRGQILWPVLLRPGTITKLPKLVWKTDRGVPERDLTLAQIYGVSAILILQPTAPPRLMEVVVYLLNGPGMAPQKSHVLRLGLGGRFAMNIVDDIVVVHHQASGTSMLFDIGLGGQMDATGVRNHEPLTAARSIKPMALPMPSLSFVGQTKSCELYSVSWVLFQPDIVIDAKLGCLWYVHLQLETMCALMHANRVRLVEFLLQRTDGKPVLMALLKRWLRTLAETGDVELLSVLATIFDCINTVYERSIPDAAAALGSASLRATLQQTCAGPRPVSATGSSSGSSAYAAARVCINQSDMYHGIFAELVDLPHIGTILLVYLGSLARLAVPLYDELARMVVRDLVRLDRLQTLRKLLETQLLQPTKVLACYLLSLSGGERTIQQMALDMLATLKDDNIIVEVLLGQGKVIDALRLATSSSSNPDTLLARKYLEAALHTTDPIVFYSVYTHFVERNQRLRLTPEFDASELCEEYVEHYRSLFG